MIEPAIFYPFRGENVLKRTAIGTILLFFWAFLIPVLIILGYLIAIIRTTVAGHDEPPAFADWRRLIVDGLNVLAIGFLYLFIPINLFAILWFFSGQDTGSVYHISSNLDIIAIVVQMSILVLIMYLMPAALTNFANQKGITSAFEFNCIMSVVITTDYLVASVITTGFIIITATTISFLNFHIIGLFVASFVIFIMLISVVRMYAKCYMKATDCYNIKN